MLNPQHFINLVLEPALKATGMYSIDAMYLMTCTALVESKLTHLKQLPDGVALGLFQIEPKTYHDIIRYLERRRGIRDEIFSYCDREVYPHESILITDLAFSTLIARIKYWMQPEPIPSYKDPFAQANYYERYYNANEEVNKVEEFVKHSKSIVGWISHE